MKAIHFSPDFSVPAVDYVNQGNAILGIRGAGKTYTAMKAAEGLLDAGIPIIVFDPIGVWKYLQFGVDDHPGYQVVVAGGGNSDLLLTPENAVDIVRASLKDGVSLVIDLHTTELATKSTWIKIVQEVVDFLLYEHQHYGLRHIFIEEAAEFIPQRVMPNQTRVYAALERLARIGRNVGLGYTLINQRAEEVNKAILEICDLTLMHKQIGKNSLKSISTGLEIRQLDKESIKAILASLPKLVAGQCWEIGHTASPLLIKVSQRNTFHPDPKKGKVTATPNVRVTNVTEFVAKLQAQLAAKPAIQKSASTGRKINKNILAQQDKEIDDLKAENKCLREELEQVKMVVPVIQAFQLVAQGAFQDMNRLLQTNAPNSPSGKAVEVQSGMGYEEIDISTLKKLAEKPQTSPASIHRKEALKTIAGIDQIVKPNGEKLGKCASTIFDFLATYRSRSFTKEQVGIYTDYSPSSGGFNSALSELRGRRMITTINGRLAWSGAYPVRIEKKEYHYRLYWERLGKCEREIYEVLLGNPFMAHSKESIANQSSSQYSPTSGGFNNALSRLSTLELIKRSSGMISLHPEIIELIKQ